MNNENKCNSCLAEVLEKILSIQQENNNDDKCVVGCDKPHLGAVSRNCLNTRPIMLYCCCADRKWIFPATINCTTVDCDVFRIENLCDNCATFRCLVNTNSLSGDNRNDHFEATNDFFAIDLNCVSAMKCLKDIEVTNL